MFLPNFSNRPNLIWNSTRYENNIRKTTKNPSNLGLGFGGGGEGAGGRVVGGRARGGPETYHHQSSDYHIPHGYTMKAKNLPKINKIIRI